MEVSYAVMLIGSPVVMEARICFASTDGNLYSVDAETGALRWKFDARSKIPSTPAVAEGTIYFTASAGSFYTLDASTGYTKSDGHAERECHLPLRFLR
jgi:outer membrane protein assembly factor BamB